MTISYDGYERWDDKVSPKKVFAVWNNDGTILVYTNNLDKSDLWSLREIDERVGSVILLPTHFKNWLNNPPKEPETFTFIAGLFGETNQITCETVGDCLKLSGGTFYTKDSPKNWKDPITLTIKEWRDIFIGCCKARDSFVGIRPLMGVVINDGSSLDN